MRLIGHSLGGSVAIVVASKRPEVISTLVVAEANLDPGLGPFSARILAAGEEGYVRADFRSALEQLREVAKDDWLSAITLGMQQLASPRAMYRTARSLVAERSPTYRELLVQLEMRRSFLVGSETLRTAREASFG